MKKTIACLYFLFASQGINAATITVNSTDSVNIADDGWCTMQEAIVATNTNTASGSSPGECVAGDAHPAMDEIVFDPAILPAHFFPVLAYELNESLAIRGPHRDLVTFTGIGLGRAMIVQNNVTNAVFEISDVTFYDNNIQTPLGTYGGAIVGWMTMGTTLTIERVNFLDNHTNTAGGALALFGSNGAQTTIRDSLFQGNYAQNTQDKVVGGGAIFMGSNEHLTIENSTFVDNFVFNFPLAQPQSDGDGGAILVRSSTLFAPSTLTITQSTFSNNATVGVGGAIALGGPGFPLEHGELTIKHSTFTQNTADSNDDLLPITGGGAIWSASSTPMNLFNSIIALNTDNANVPAPSISGAVNNFGYNFIGNNSTITTVFPAGQPNANHDWVGVHFAEIDPQLAPLADNGGSTPTHLPLAGSLVIDQGKCNALTHDQRYQQNSATDKREFDQPNISNALTGCDIGAVELDAPDASNPAPIAIADNYTILEGETLTISATSGLLANDSDNDPLVVTSAGAVTTSGVTGTATVDSAGGVTFTADDADDNGTATFTYTISDGINSVSKTATITITPVNDAPTFTPSTLNINATPGQAVTIPAWATDISRGPANESGQILWFVFAGDSNFVSQWPAVDATTGDLTFTLAATATGSETYELRLLDGGSTDNGGVNFASAFLVLTANNGSISAADDAYSLLEGDTLSVSAVNGLLSNDSGSNLSVNAETVTTSGDVSGEVVIAADGSFTFTPDDSNANGTATFVYTVANGSDTASAQVVLTIIPVNDAPTFVATSTMLQVIAGQQNVNIMQWANNISPGATNELTQTLNFQVLTSPAAFFTTPPQVDASTGNLTFTVSPSASGSATITVRLQDNGGTTHGGVNVSVPVVLTVTIGTTPNQAPIANAQSISLDENTSVNLTLTGNDADGDTLAYAIATPPSHGSLSGSAPNITYTPNADYVGSDSFQFKVNDGTADSAPATVSITVNATTPPPAGDDIFSDGFE